MIKGVGVDIIGIERVGKVYSRHEERFLEKYLTKAEQEYALKGCTNERMAARWAAKEAVAKALGTGFSDGILFTDIEVCHNENKAPFIKLHNKAKEYAEKINVKNIHCSISHADGMAIAFVTLEGTP